MDELLAVFVIERGRQNIWTDLLLDSYADLRKFSHSETGSEGGGRRVQGLRKGVM